VINTLNGLLQNRGIGLSLDYQSIRSAYAKFTVRERHVAKALFHAFDLAFSDTERLEKYRVLFGDQSFAADLSNTAALQEEIRNRLLKAGQPAFVEENQAGFLGLKDVASIILDGGGVPCYPVLADDSIPLSEYERDVSALAGHLTKLDVYAVEFIPSRNTFDHLKKYVKHFHERGFCVTFGTEHNTPKLAPLTPAARGGVPFDNELQRIAYRGACILAAHQERRKNKCTGFVDIKGKLAASGTDLEDLILLGDSVIRRARQQGCEHG
jgi:hypothetical protein